MAVRMAVIRFVRMRINAGSTGEPHAHASRGTREEQDRRPHAGEPRDGRRVDRLIEERVRQLARRLVYRSRQPGPVVKGVLSAAHHAHVLSREALEWGVRSLFATPTFLSLCAAHGERISVDRVPYMVRVPRIEIGSDVRISGRITIFAGSDGDPVLRIGSGVFIGHNTTIAVADRVEIGDYTAIGGGSYITDTEGHSHSRLDVPIWEDRAGRGNISPVIIEDNVHIARCCTILKGVRVGARSILGASSVVRSDVPPDSILMGNPARATAWRPAGGA
jgi:acetyltransferase-like isoleucine patch superfamily enzyme